jgi:hypothetical protein
VRVADLGVELGRHHEPDVVGRVPGTAERAAVAGEIMVMPSELHR